MRINRKLNTLVENRTVFCSEVSELNLFETYKIAERVDLTFDYPVLVNMITGKKVMHIESIDSFDFYPGETLIMPMGKEMVIDFPEATFSNPTQCLALGIDPTIINETIHQFNELVSVENDRNHQWEVSGDFSFLGENQELQPLINRLIQTFTTGSKSRDALLDLMLKELIIRLLQTEAKATIIKSTNNIYNNHRIAYVVKYIRDNLSDNLTIDQLADKVYLSPSHFHKLFKNTLGESPVTFLIKERINLAKKMIRRENYTIAEVAERVGFNNVSYFNRQFKKYEGVSPGQYQKQFS